jgi:uncharacterized membrane protein
MQLRSGDRALKAAAVFWYLVVAAGQGAFLLYILGFYGPTALTGEFEAWRRNENLVQGYVAGDPRGNLAFLIHAVLAAVLTLGGLLQLVPALRDRAPALHRWNGRLYIAVAFTVAGAGLFLNAHRGAGGFDPAAITLNAVLIYACAAIALGFAMARKIDSHRRWALRTFMVVGGVWFLRVGMAAFFMAAMTIAPALKPHAERAFDIWSYGSYLVPLALLQLYFLAQSGGSNAVKLFMALILILATLVMAAGAIGAAAGMWLPLAFGKA